MILSCCDELSKRHLWTKKLDSDALESMEFIQVNKHTQVLARTEVDN